MINSKYFLKGFKSIKGVGSPAIALGASFIAIGALLKNLGFSIEESIFSDTKEWLQEDEENQLLIILDNLHI